MRVTITLDYPQNVSQYGDNAYYSGKHWAQRKKDRDFWHDLLLTEAPWEFRPLRSPVRITYYWNDRLDLSNHSMMAKMIEDGIKGRIIEDDSRKHVQEIVHKFYNQNVITVVIEEMED